MRFSATSREMHWSRWDPLRSSRVAPAQAAMQVPVDWEQIVFDAIGELIDVTVGDIEDRKHGEKIVIEGKTGARRLPLVESLPHINAWLSKHPNPEKDAPLWCKIQQGDPDESLGYRYIREKSFRRTWTARRSTSPPIPTTTATHAPPT